MNKGRVFLLKKVIYENAPLMTGNDPAISVVLRVKYMPSHALYRTIVLPRTTNTSLFNKFSSSLANILKKYLSLSRHTLVSRYIRTEISISG
jgi:hypothetical protein